MQTFLLIYAVFSLATFCYGVVTACEDVQLMRAHGIRGYPYPSFFMFVLLFIVSYIPLINIGMFGMTYLYRKGQL